MAAVVGQVRNAPRDATGDLRILFLHSPKHPHPSHVALADRLGATTRAPFSPQGFQRGPAAVLTAWRLARRDDWEALFAEGPCLDAVFLRVFDRRRRRRARLDSQNSSVQLATDRFLTRMVRRLEFRCWDAVVVIGDVGARATHELVPASTEVIPWLPPVTKGDPFGRVVADRSGPVISLVTGGARHRVRYKGLDRLAALSRRAKREGFDPVVIYGAWSPQDRQPFEDALVFAGHRPSDQVLVGASALVHLSRYDAFPVAIVEAMLAGIPPIVAEAGSAMLVDAVEPRLHVADEASALEALRWLRGLSAVEYSGLSARMRAEALRYLDSDAGGPGVAAIRRALMS